jgi:hypothetical protein
MRFPFSAGVRLDAPERGGTGTWQIVERTGRYTTLRGVGTYVGTKLSGDSNVFESITYRTSWQGVVGFDAEPPAIGSLSATVRKLPRPAGAYVLRVSLTARDAAPPVSFTLDVRAGQTGLGLRQCSTALGQAAVTLRIRPPRGVHGVRIASR